MPVWIIKLFIIYTLLLQVLFGQQQDDLQNILEPDQFMEMDITQKDLFGYNEDGIVADENNGEDLGEDIDEEGIDKNMNLEGGGDRETNFMVDDSTDDDCSVFPNQTFFRPHFYSCHNDGM